MWPNRPRRMTGTRVPGQVEQLSKRVGPAHILTRQRPARLGGADRSNDAVCVFAPDGSLVLALPPDPERAWVGFSDPVQWY